MSQAVFQNYVVALIDFLNQGEELDALNRIPDEEPEKARFIAAADKALIPIDHFRKLFEDFARSAHAAGQFEPLMTVEVKRQCFRDTTITYSPLRNAAGELTLAGVFNALVATGCTLLASLASGVPFRGGIEVGVGTEFFPGEIYGPVLRRAYYLESKVADHPRVVLGNGVTEYLQDQAELPASDRDSPCRREVARLCHSFISIDEDGMPIVDYLGRGFCDFTSAVDRQAQIAQALEFVDSGHKRFMAEGNTKLALRYARLKQYFLARRNGA
ncbi:MAG: hypothetical protein GX547_16015 [Phycisphaerae bacterium]|nr:hypothetical protein [Phycisphaerae bacterium]